MLVGKFILKNRLDNLVSTKDQRPIDQSKVVRI